MVDLAEGRRTFSLRHPGWIAGPLLLLASALFYLHAATVLPPSRWLAALLAPSDTGTGADLDTILFLHSHLPRLAVGLLAGLALGLSGCLFQQVLRNPLAEPGTLGVFAGAKLAIVIGALGFVTLPSSGQALLAAIGGIASLAVVLLIAWGDALRPVRVILAGLVITLLLDAVARCILLFQHAALLDLFVWQGGALGQNNWGDARTLLGACLLLGAATIPLLTPLALLDLEEEGARGLGVPMAWTRLGGITIAMLLAVAVVATVGVIGFVGLAGPAIARLSGAVRFRRRLVWGSLLSAALLVLTDQAVATIETGFALPTGAVTAFLGAPFLLWMLRQRLSPDAPAPDTVEEIPVIRHPMIHIAAALAVIVLFCWGALSFGQGPDGWIWARGDLFADLLAWRGPRVTVALAAGAMLAMAGVILQRVTGNSLASPELLGVSSGAALALIAVGLLAPSFGRPLMVLAGSTGAFVTLCLLLLLGRGSGQAPDRLLLAGVALTALQGACLALLLFTGDPRTMRLLGWLSGSTYGTGAGDAAITVAIAVPLCLAAPFFARWLAILPLGAETGRSLGIGLGRARLLLLSLAALLTATATLAVGPLGFVGLMAPHLARLSGFHRPALHLTVAALYGAGIMVLADWAGRSIAFPWQIPAGLMATLVGALYFLFLLGRRRS